MLHAVVTAALSLVSIGVPYVPQTDALCGGAAAAMVFRYWGDAHASAGQFAALVEHRPGGVNGIANDVLVRAVQTRAWLTEQVEPTVDAIRARLDRGQPIIVLIPNRRNSYHYVVVVGADEDGVLVHDPSWGPSRRMTIASFERLWAAAHHWSLVILPSTTRAALQTTTAPSETATSSATTPDGDSCGDLLNRAIADVGADGFDRAEDRLTSVQARCPASAGPIRELAGVRFAQKRWAEAATLARRALTIDPDDEYTIDLLGSSLFMQDDQIGALRAWNRVGRPQLDLVRIEGVRRSRHQTIAEALGLEPNTILTADAFVRAQHRLGELPDRSSARLAVRPETDGFASVDVAIAERAGRPRGVAAWTAVAVRAAVDREASLSLPGFTGQGELWTGSWRWEGNRPRVAIGFAAPRGGTWFGVWRVDGSWEEETYASGRTLLRETRKHGGVSVSDWLSGNVRYALRAGFDAWDGGTVARDRRRAASIGGSMERRWFDDRVSIGGDVTRWIGVGDGPGFSAAGVRATARSATRPRGWVYQGTVGVDRVGDSAPMTLWPGAGEGRARSPLLRAHPLIDSGIIDLDGASAFGRSVAHGNAEVQRWLARPALVHLGAAAFVDVARASRRATRGPDRDNGLADVGVGLRVRMPGGASVLRVDVAHGVRDGANALTVGWAF